MKNEQPKPGPTPETIKVEGDVDWKDALKHAMSKPKPSDCTHPSLSREVVGMQKTGDYVCSSCGETFTSEEAREIRRKREGQQE